MTVETKSKLSQEIEEIIKKIAESQAKFQKEYAESQAKFQKEYAESQAEFQKEHKEFKKEQRELQKLRKETDLQIKQMITEGEKDRKATKKHMDELDTLFGDHWGKLMESLVKGDLLKLLQERGINVDDIAKEREKTYKGKKYEFDIIAIDGGEMVVVEVKTTLRLQDINHFEAKLKLFKEIFPAYKKKNIYGCMAYLKANHGSSERAMKKRFFVIRATGSSASIINSKNFKPKAF